MFPFNFLIKNGLIRDKYDFKLKSKRQVRIYFIS